MENKEQTNQQTEETILKTLQDKFSELKDIAGESLDQVQEKAEELLAKVKSSEFVDETKKTITDLSEEAKQKMGNLAEEAKGIWNKLTGGQG